MAENGNARRLWSRPTCSPSNVGSRSLLVILAVALSSGCGAPANPQKLREEVLKVDPNFSEVLQKRDEQANRIALLEREFDLKRTQVEQQIAQLRKDVKDALAQVEQKVQKSKALLKPDVDRLHLALSTANDERQAKRVHRTTLSRSISRFKKTLKEGAAGDRARVERELNELLHEAQRLDRELQALNEHIRLLKIKLLLLRV